MKNKSLLLLLLVGLLCWLPPLYAATNQKKAIAPMLSLLLSGSATMQENIPSLVLMVAKDTDKIEMAWIPGSDGITPVDQIQYKIYLSTVEIFTPGPATLKKKVTGTSQTEITGLATDTLYFGKVVAVYTASTSDPSNSLQSKTYKYKVLVDNSTIVAIAADLGLGKHTTLDGTTYTYVGGTPPDSGSALFSEDTAGGMTLRTVDSTSSSGGIVTVHTSDASLTDVLDRAAVYSSFQLFDVATQAKGLPAVSTKFATAKSLIRKDGSLYSRIAWKNRLLFAEQTNYVYNNEDLIVEPQGKTSVIKLFEPKAVTQSFTATVTAEFEPKLISSAEWGGTVVKELYSAKVAAKGTLSLTALAQYDFSASGSVSKNFQLFERTWYSFYTAGPVPVYQEITLSMDVAVSASASAEIKAMAQANLTETVEVGAIYNGSSWSPYITHNESNSLSASLDIVGQAKAEIRLIPKIEVKFYKVSSASLTVEPFANSSLSFEETTNNLDFLAAHPNRLIQLTSFNALLGIESNVAVSLGILGYKWELLPSTCVLGTGSCTYKFNPITLFSIPVLKVSITDFTATQTDLKLEVTDGSYNPFNQSSINWESFPGDATITPGGCTKSGPVTTCTATFEPSTTGKYNVFVSGHGRLGEISRQFKELPIGGGCPTGDQTVIWGEGEMQREWQRCDDGRWYNYEDSISYCDELILDGHSDWRMPDLTELKSLVVCTNGCPVPLKNPQSDPYYCGDDSCPGAYERPTIDPSFQCDNSSVYWTSTFAYEGRMWAVWFGDGGMVEVHPESMTEVRCVRD